MGEELQSHVKIKVSSLPLLRLLHTAPHLPELESFFQDESPQDTPESPPPPPLSAFLFLSGGRLLSSVSNILLRLQRYRRASDQSGSLVMLKI